MNTSIKLGHYKTFKKHSAMSKIYIYAALSLLMTTNCYAAIEEKEYAKCAAIAGDLARLECFDILAKSKNLDGRQSQPTEIAGKGKWNVSIDINPIDDSKTVMVMLRANPGGHPAGLAVRCKSHQTSLIIGWNDYLGNKADVLTRAGNNKATTQRWGVSSNKKSTFHPKPIPFLKELLQSNKLVAQVTPYNESPATAIFDTTGLVNAIKPLRETCGW
ncbi:MAG: type VI secretion protein [Xanthomonadales bacterium]|nr:type VI secretion protein [Xanthomonadales bacterium]